MRPVFLINDKYHSNTEERLIFFQYIINIIVLQKTPKERKGSYVTKQITKLEISSSATLSSFPAENVGSSPPLSSIFLIIFEEYNITPNLIGTLFLYKDIITSMDCKATRKARHHIRSYVQQK